MTQADRERMGVALAAVFGLSGMASLAYEIVWVRQVTLLIGSTSWALSLTVAAFLLGLSLGSLLGGKLADRTTRGLRMYAAFETAAGLLGVGLTYWLSALQGGGWLGRTLVSAPLLVRLLLAAVFLLPPTIAMGATLPILTRFMSRRLPSLGRDFTGLYALNTLGAALGCSLAGFFAIPAFGLKGTAVAAAALNLLAAIAALLLERRMLRPADADPQVPDSPDALDGSPELRALTPSGRQRLIFIFAVTGFISIAYELLWFRSLGLYLQSTVYAFTVLLTVYLLGLALGAGIYAVVLQPRKQDLAYLAAVQLLLAFSGLLSMVLLMNAKQLNAALVGSLGGSIFVLLAPALLVLLLPSTLIGISFPLVVQATATRLERVGEQVGWLYSVNTLGGILGSLLVGFALVPWVGTQTTFVVIALLGATLSLAVSGLDGGLQGGAGRKRMIAAALVLPAAFLVPPGAFIERYASSEVGKALAVVEGRDGTMVVREYSAAVACKQWSCSEHCLAHPYRHRQIRYASMSYSSTIMHARRYMTALAVLGLASSEHADSALIVAFGTGITAGSTLLFPELKRLQIVDINRDVLRFAPYFEEANRHVLKDPRTQVTIDDGRHYLAAAAEDKRWDLISFEPPPPEAPGIVSLYSSEFYQLVKKHLTPGGRMTQWIPLQEQSDRINRMLVRSMTETFKYVLLFIPSRDEAVLLASDTPPQLDLKGLTRRFGEPEFRQAMLLAGYQDPYELLGGFMMGPTGLGQWASALGDPAITDDRPAVEYARYFEGAAYDREALLKLREPIDAWVKGPVDAVAFQWRRDESEQLLHVSQEIFAGNFDAAASRLDTLIAKEGETPHLHFLRQDLLECMLPPKLRPPPPKPQAPPPKPQAP